MEHMIHGNSRCRILIVEDELIVRKALRYIIEKEKGLFSIIGEVTNGEEAVQFLKQELPDVMICDIMMPKMNGLELLRITNLTYPEIHSIVLSGYHDFEYVKQAFQYGVVDYILKPELEDAHLLEQLYGIGKKLGMISDRSKEALSASVHYIIAIQPGKNLQGFAAKQEVVIRHIEDMIQKCFGRFYTGGTFLTKHQVYVYYISCHYEEMFEGRLHEFIPMISQYFRNMEMIISQPYFTAEKIQEEAEQLGEMFPYRFFNNEIEYLNLASLKVHEAGKELDKKAFYEGVRQLRLDDSRNLLLDFLKAQHYFCSMTASGLKKHVENILYNTIFELQEVQCCPKELEERKLIYLSDISQSENLGELIETADGIFTELRDAVEKNQNQDVLYFQILSYIHTHYNQAITLKTLSDCFNMNYSYLSSYLSSRMGQGMNEFLNAVRVEKAKELLTQTNLPLLEIAENIGYSDQSYFGKVFKKLTGVSPLAYRGKSKRQGDL